MNHCGSHDCYSENAMYNDFYDFNLEIRELFPCVTLFQILYSGSLVLLIYSVIYACYSFRYPRNYLDDFSKSEEDDETYCEYDGCNFSKFTKRLKSFSNDDVFCEYDRENWPYCSYSKVPYDLKERMNFWEKNSQQITKVEPDYPFIVRIDGCNFSKFTKRLKSFSNDGVFSDEFRKAMLDTACDLLVKFRPTTVYTHSDEITLVFRDYVGYDDDGNEIITGEHYRKGKVYKLLSEIPSVGSTAFTRNIQSQYSKNPDALEYLSQSDLAFDGRLLVFPLESEYEVANHMIWRTRDCYRNYVSAYAEKHLGKSTLDKVPTEERVRRLKEKGIDLDDETNLRGEQLGMKYGTFLKLHDADKNGHVIQAFYSTKLEFSDELLDFMLEPMKDLKYDLGDDENASDVEKDVEIKSSSSFAIDSYEFEDVFDGTFTLKKPRNKNK